MEALITKHFCFKINLQSKILQGLNILLPFFDRIKYVQVLKELAIEVPQQGAVTSDNVQLQIDGVLYLRIVDPYKVYKRAFFFLIFTNYEMNFIPHFSILGTLYFEGVKI